MSVIINGGMNMKYKYEHRGLAATEVKIDELSNMQNKSDVYLKIMSQDRPIFFGEGERGFYLSPGYLNVLP